MCFCSGTHAQILQFIIILMNHLASPFATTLSTQFAISCWSAVAYKAKSDVAVGRLHSFFFVSFSCCFLCCHFTALKKTAVLFIVVYVVCVSFLTTKSKQDFLYSRTVNESSWCQSNLHFSCQAKNYLYCLAEDLHEITKRESYIFEHS